jgi:hypothetical protein
MLGFGDFKPPGRKTCALHGTFESLRWVAF